MLLTGHATSATLGKDAMVGVWETSEPQDIFSSISRLLAVPARDRLEIDRDLSVRFTRRLKGGDEQVLIAQPSMVSFQRELVIVRFPFGSGTAKLVLAGWSSQYSRRLFGTLYLHDANGLFNGIPVSFQPVGDG